MKSPATRTIETTSPEQTQKIAAAIGRGLSETTLIFLKGDLAAGKTAFVQGLARGLGVSEDAYITSPTYTLINEHFGRMELVHADLYRLGDPEELFHIGLSDMLAENVVMAVEWPETAIELLPQPDILIEFDHTGDNRRKIQFSTYRLALSNLINTASI